MKLRSKPIQDGLVRLGLFSRRRCSRIVPDEPARLLRMERILGAQQCTHAGYPEESGFLLVSRRSEPRRTVHRSCQRRRFCHRALYLTHELHCLFPFEGWNSLVYEQTLKDELDQLYQESATHRRLMVISLHDCISGHAGRVRLVEPPSWSTRKATKGMVWTQRRNSRLGAQDSRAHSCVG